MGTITTIDRERLSRGEAGPPRPAALKVTLEAVPPRDACAGIITLTVRVRGARMPVRLYLYIDGDLVDAWVEGEGVHEIHPEDIEPGRHAVTARAVDALGRWAGASITISVSEGASTAPSEASP